MEPTDEGMLLGTLLISSWEIWIGGIIQPRLTNSGGSSRRHFALWCENHMIGKHLSDLCNDLRGEINLRFLLSLFLDFFT